MKSMFILIFALSTSAFAAECVNEKGEDIFNQPEVFQALIENAESCYQAGMIAESCAYGSSLDVSTAGLADQLCRKELAQMKPSKKLMASLNSMTTLCNDKYKNEQGTMYRSANAFCNLSAVEWIVQIATPN